MSNNKTVTVTFSRAVNVDSVDGFSVDVTGHDSPSIESYSLSNDGRTLTLTLDRILYSGSVVNIDYVADGAVRARDGWNSLASFTDTVVANNIPAEAAAVFSRDFSEATLGDDATFARSTVATMVDNEGRVIELPANAARMSGARVVHNQSNTGAYTSGSASISTTGSGSSTVRTVTNLNLSSNADRYNIYNDQIATSSTPFLAASIKVKAENASDIGKTVTLQLRDAAPATIDQIQVTLAADYVRYALAGAPSAVGTVNLWVHASGQTATACVLTDFQLEETTGRADPAQCSEYVSSGVATGAEEITNGTFGANVDDWTKYGANDVTTWDSLGGGSAKITRQLASGYEGALQDTGLILNGTYQITCRTYRPTGSDTVLQFRESGGTLNDVTPSSFDAWEEFSFVVSAIGSAQIQIFSSAGSIGAVGYFDNVSVKRADHGLFADGIKAFTRENAIVVNDGTQNSTELLTNGGFDTDTVWSKGTDWTISGGRARNPGSASSVTQSGVLTIGVAYAGLIKIDAMDGGFVDIYCGTAYQSFSAPGVHAFNITCAGNTNFAIYNNGSSSVVIDSVTCLQYVSGDDTGTVDETATGALISPGPSLLMEPAADNLLTHSQDFTDAAWVVTAADTQITANQAIAPDGTVTAEKVADTAVVNVPRNFFQNAGNSSNSPHTASIFVKNGNRRYAWVQAAGQSGASLTRHTAVFDLETGLLVDTYQVNSPTNTDEKIEPAGNGYFRISATCGHDGSSAVYAIYGLSDSATPSYDAAIGYPRYTGDGSFVYFWQADLVAGSVPSSPIKTEGTTVQRNADTLSYPLTTPQTEGMAVVEFSMSTSAISAGVLSWSSTDRTNAIYKNSPTEIISYDEGVSISRPLSDIDYDNDLIVGLRWNQSNGERELSLKIDAGSWSSAVDGTYSFDGWPSSDNTLNISEQSSTPIKYKNVTVYSTDEGQDFIEDTHT